jgi:hypothetical protein
MHYFDAGNCALVKFSQMQGMSNKKIRETKNHSTEWYNLVVRNKAAEM